MLERSISSRNYERRRCSIAKQFSLELASSFFPCSLQEAKQDVDLDLETAPRLLFYKFQIEVTSSVSTAEELDPEHVRPSKRSSPSRNAAASMVSVGLIHVSPPPRRPLGVFSSCGARPAAFLALALAFLWSSSQVLFAAGAASGPATADPPSGSSMYPPSAVASVISSNSDDSFPRNPNFLNPPMNPLGNGMAEEDGDEPLTLQPLETLFKNFAALKGREPTPAPGFYDGTRSREEYFDRAEEELDERAVLTLLREDVEKDCGGILRAMPAPLQTAFAELLGLRIVSNGSLAAAPPADEVSGPGGDTPFLAEGTSGAAAGAVAAVPTVGTTCAAGVLASAPGSSSCSATPATASEGLGKEPSAAPAEAAPPPSTPAAAGPAQQHQGTSAWSRMSIKGLLSMITLTGGGSSTEEEVEDPASVLERAAKRPRRAALQAGGHLLRALLYSDYAKEGSVGPLLAPELSLNTAVSEESARKRLSEEEVSLAKDIYVRAHRLQIALRLPGTGFEWYVRHSLWLEKLTRDQNEIFGQSHRPGSTRILVKVFNEQCIVFLGREQNCPNVGEFPLCGEPGPFST